MASVRSEVPQYLEGLWTQIDDLTVDQRATTVQVERETFEPHDLPDNLVIATPERGVMAQFKKKIRNALVFCKDFTASRWALIEIQPVSPRCAAAGGAIVGGEL